MVKRRGIALLHPFEQTQRVVVARAWADLEIEPRHGLEVVVEHVRARESMTISAAPSFLRKSGVRISMVVPGAWRRTSRTTSAKWAAPAIGQVVAVDRGDDHVRQAHLGHRRADTRGARRRRAAPAGRCATLQKAQARVQTSPMIIMVACVYGPALADVGAGRLLADGVQAAVAHDLARLHVAGRTRRLHAQPVGLAQDRGVGALSFLRVPGAAGRDRVHHRDHDSRMRPVCEGRYVVFPSQLIKFPSRLIKRIDRQRRNVARPDAGCGIRAQVDAKRYAAAVRAALALMVLLVLAACSRDAGGPLLDSRTPPSLGPRFFPPEGWGLVSSPCRARRASVTGRSLPTFPRVRTW